MTATESLIDELSNSAHAVAPIAPPAQRAAIWLGAAALVVSPMTALVGLRPDLLTLMREPMFDVDRLAALLTALTAAVASFHVSVPGRSLAWLWLPLPFAACWIAMMGYGCLADWFREGEEGLRLGGSYECFVAIVGSSLPLGLILLFMVRHAARVRAIPTAIAGGVASAAIAELGLTFYHRADASQMDLLVHLTAMVVVALGAALSSRRAFTIVDPLRRTRSRGS